MGIQHHAIPMAAPWQHGMVERHGQDVADIAKAVTCESQVIAHMQAVDVIQYAGGQDEPVTALDR